MEVTVSRDAFEPQPQGLAEAAGGMDERAGSGAELRSGAGE